MTRRSLLGWLFGLLGLDAAGVLRPPPGITADTARLTGAELEDLVAFAEVVVEGRALASAERQALVEHIEDRVARRSGALELYRTAVRTLERVGGRRMAGLEVPERLALVGRHRLAVALVRPSEDLGPLADDVRALRTRVVPDLIGGYYNSAAGWAAVGYATFPGRCGDLTRYSRPETALRD
jgi:hypothetical protein